MPNGEYEPRKVENCKKKHKVTLPSDVINGTEDYFDNGCPYISEFITKQNGSEESVVVEAADPPFVASRKQGNGNFLVYCVIRRCSDRKPI